MKPVISLLKKLGLSNTEVSLYLHGLQFNKVNVATLVQISKIQRTTAYHALDTLCQKGLATQSKEDGKLYYQMTPATELETILISRREQLNGQIEELQSTLSLFPVPTVNNDTLPDVSNYRGIKGVQTAIDRALYSKDRYWRIISPVNNYFRNSNLEYINYFKSKRQERGIEAKSLWESMITHSDHLTADDIKTRHPRIMPKTMEGKFKSSIIIFDDKVLIISSYKQQFATLISSKETANTFALMFDAIWDISKVID